MKTAVVVFFCLWFCTFGVLLYSMAVNSKLIDTLIRKDKIIDELNNEEDEESN